MEAEMLDIPNLEKPLYFQKNSRKISTKKKSTDSKPTKNKFNDYDPTTTDFIAPYKRTRSPVPFDANSNISLGLNKINESETLDFDYNNITSFFNIDIDNIIEPPDIQDEKFLDFDVYSPLTDLERKNTNKMNNNNFEDNLSSLCKYGLRYVNNDILNCINDRNDKIIFLQSCIRSFLVKKKLNISLLNKIFLERKNIKKIILLQKNLRCFLAKLRIRKKIIINYIKQKRKKAIQLIINKMKSYKNVLKMKKIYFIKNKIEERNKNAKYIQEKFRNYRFYNSFKKFKKEINEKYCIIYPCKGEKVELIIYLEDQNSDLDSKKYAFNYNKLLNCFVLFINPDDLYAGQYKCQFIIDDIIICDKNYPYIQYKNELYNIIEFKTNKKIKEKKRKKKKDKKKANNNKINENNKNVKEKNIKDKKTPKNYKNNYYQEEELNDELEDIKEEDDEEKSIASKEYMKKKKDYIDIEEIDFTEEDIFNIKKLKGNNIVSTDYKKLREELISQRPISQEDKIRKKSFKNYNFNY
jgi:hypothetical protein